jgi:mannose-6-phosphate isomerase-like protein (cupin superfamily)
MIYLYLPLAVLANLMLWQEIGAPLTQRWAGQDSAAKKIEKLDLFGTVSAVISYGISNVGLPGLPTRLTVALLCLKLNFNLRFLNLIQRWGKTPSKYVKHIVNQLTTHKRAEHNLDRKVHRPWGWYDITDERGHFNVKRIQVSPKAASLSLQKNHQLAECRIVVAGTAKITIGEKVLTLTENQFTYIPQVEVQRLSKPGSIPLEIIEVQSGSYLGEDDIFRFEEN